ncbi:MAG: response regulator [Ardenticatenaceae bacterium]|nr:response regulator [Ardenticatenaceae bacterium]
MKSIAGHILVVDDDKTNRLILELGLKKQGHQVTTAANGRQALEMIRSRPIDLVLLDIVMPEIDGFAVLTQLKSHPRLKDIPVIVISAVEEMESVVKCIEMGAEDHLPKPFDPIFLRARINAGLQKKRFRDREIEYLRQMAHITKAAIAIENKTFDPAALDEIARRDDTLGTLGRVFQQMAREVASREAQLAQDNQIKAAFIDVITHELRSPFASAAMSVELLQKFLTHQMVDQVQNQLDQLSGELDQGRRLIETIIGFADQVTKEPQLDLQRGNFYQVIRDSLTSLQPLANGRKVTLTWDDSVNLPPLRIDAQRMQDVMHHLVHNAVKFTPAGGEIVIKSTIEDDYLVVKVKDNGVGIPPERMASIWEPFSQCSDRVRRGVDGLGLGLPLVQAIIHAHHGEISAVSEPGIGSVFYFRLPLAYEVEKVVVE